MSAGSVITRKDLEDLGFTCDESKTSSHSGEYTTFNKTIDNNHVIFMHDYQEVFIHKELDRFIIEVHHQSSWVNEKEIRFKGNIIYLHFLEEVLDSITNF